MVGAAVFMLLAVVTAFKSHKLDSLQSNSVLGCGVYLSEVRWMYEDAGFFAAICGYEPAFGSWSTCIYDMLDDRVPENRDLLFEKTYSNVKELCLSGNPQFARELTFEQYNASRNNASRYLPQLGYINMEDPLACPIEVDKTMRDKIANAYHYYNSNLDRSFIYGLIPYGYFMLIALVSWGFKIINSSALSRLILKYRIINLIRGYLILPTLGGKHASPLEINWLFTGLVPTTFEGAMVLGYALLSVVTLAIAYQLDHYNILFPTELIQLIRLLGDRSGIIAVVQIPLIILFCARNSIVEAFTGFKYTTMIVLHKWIGRVMILETCVHSLAYALYATLLKSYRESSSMAYWRFGVVATTSCLGLLVLSIGLFRKYAYETFLYTHIALVVIFFYAYFKHVEQFGFGSTIYVPIALWVFERIIRIIRVLKFGFLTANLQLVGQDLIRITIKLPPAASRKVFEPGQYIFLYFMQPSIFWQSHPFTVIQLDDELILVVKPKKGATYAILQKLRENGSRLDMKVLIEGPYGSKSPINKSDRLLFLAGGTGIPGPLSHAIELGTKQSNRIIDLVLTVRELDILRAYEKELLLLRTLPVHLTIHLTRNTVTRYGSTTDTDVLATLQPFTSLRNGRCDVEKLISNSISDGPLAVVCCGPASFVDHARDSTAKTIVENPHAIVEYFEEYQCW